MHSYGIHETSGNSPLHIDYNLGPDGCGEVLDPWVPLSLCPIMAWSPVVMVRLSYFVACLLPP